MIMKEKYIRYLAIDQYGQTTLLKDKTYKEIRNNYYCGRIKPMYIDTTKGVKKVGYVLGQGQGNTSLWVTIEKLSPAFN